MARSKRFPLVGGCMVNRFAAGLAARYTQVDLHSPRQIPRLGEEPRLVRAILEHLSLWDVPRPRPSPVTDL